MSRKKTQAEYRTLSQSRTGCHKTNSKGDMEMEGQSWRAVQEKDRMKWHQEF